MSSDVADSRLKGQVFFKKATVEKVACFCLYRVNLLLTLLTAV